MKIDFKNYEAMLAAINVLHVIEGRGFNAVIAGGAVRDVVMGRIPSDFDIATNMPVAALESLFPSHDIGKSKDFGLITITHCGHQFEVAQFRSDGKYTDGRRPDDVKLVSTFEEDSSRRDFTINSMGLTKEGEVLDFHGGERDIRLNRINTVGDPEQRFKEDYLRMIRAARFAAVFGMKISAEVEKAIFDLRHNILNVSKERIRDELFKAAKVNKLAFLIGQMRVLGLLEIILPEVESLFDVDQKDEVRNIHLEGNALAHTIMVMKMVGTVDLQFSALFHDLGKVETRSVSPEGKVQFLRHEEASVRIAEKVMRRLCFPSDMMNRILVLVGNHMRFHTMEGHANKAIRKLVRQIGVDAIHPLMDMSEADALGVIPPDGYMADARVKVQSVLDSPLPVRREPVLNGKQIIAILQISPGPMVGVVKEFLLNMEDEMAEMGQALTPADAEGAIRQNF